MPTVCPVKREEFDALAAGTEVYLMVNGVRYDLEPRDTAEPTESLGWAYNNRETIPLGSLKVPVMIGANVTLINSKLERKNK